MHRSKQKLFLTEMLMLGTVLLAGCAGKSSASTSTADTSVSGSVAAAIGGAYNGSSTNGTMASLNRMGVKGARILSYLNPISVAHAAGATCPTFVAEACTPTSPLSLTYDDCSFKGSSAVWSNGGVKFTCPTGSVTRAITNGTTRTTASGYVATISTQGLQSFSGVTVADGGTTLSSNSITINGVEFMVKGPAGVELLDHIIVTPSPLTVSASGVVTGVVTTYHQIDHVQATSNVNVTMKAGCCTPESGTIVTLFTVLPNYPATSGSAFAGDAGAGGVFSETLTINSCGVATYTGLDGSTGTVSLACQ